MKAYRKYVTIEEPGWVVLEDLPFSPGQVVEVILIAKDTAEVRTEELRALLGETRNALGAGSMGEDEIAEEIAAYRTGR